MRLQKTIPHRIFNMPSTYDMLKAIKKYEETYNRPVPYNFYEIVRKFFIEKQIDGIKKQEQEEREKIKRLNLAFFGDK